MVGKGKTSGPTTTAKDHTSRPLTSLKDPAAFGPPPKNVNYHGGAAVPNAITPDRRGLGEPLSADELRPRQDEERREEEETRKPAPPPTPYRADRTGLRTDTLPAPPSRSTTNAVGESHSTKPKPKLPPRLPPRQNSNPSRQITTSPPPPYSPTGQPPSSPINPSPASRLGSAGIKEPTFNIGASSTTQSSDQPQQRNPWRDQPSPAKSPTSVSTLQSRFGGLKTTTSPPPSQSNTASGGGTSFAQKEAALRTASAFHNDPHSVSMADAKATASTANNFRERHGEQVASGWKAGNNLNKKYGVADRVGGYAGAQGTSSQQNSPASSAAEWAGQGTEQDSGTTGNRAGFGQVATSAIGGFKKAPPPPPPVQRRDTGGLSSPPPVPLGSKPR